MKVYSKIGVKSNVLKYPGVCLETRVFDTLTWGVIAPQSLHLPLQTKPFPHPSQKTLEQRKEMTFDRRWGSITDPVLVFRGSYCLSENL